MAAAKVHDMTDNYAQIKVRDCEKIEEYIFMHAKMNRGLCLGLRTGLHIFSVYTLFH